MKPQRPKSSSSQRPTSSLSTSIPLQEASLFNQMVNTVSNNYLTESWERKYYADRYTCCPPPVFITMVSLLQVLVFIVYLYFPDESFNSVDSTKNLGLKERHVIGLLGPVPFDSMLIYHPEKRIEVWRFFTYMFVHAGWIHLLFNLTVQLLIGLPLEMVHGSTRLGIIYLTGVVAGSLSTSIFDPHTILVGASGGVYALLTAHLANVLLNYHNMHLGFTRILAVILVGEFNFQVVCSILLYSLSYFITNLFFILDQRVLMLDSQFLIDSIETLRRLPCPL